MKANRRRVTLSGMAMTATLASSAVLAQSYPVKPIRWLNPAAPGGAHDVVARGLLPSMVETLGQPLIVENMSGAAGIVAQTTLARAANDGYTLGMGTSTTLVVTPFIQAKVPFDTLKDFTYGGLIGSLSSVVFVHNAVPVANFKELVDYSRANPGKLNYGSGGIGHSFHLTGESQRAKLGLDLTHVPYKSTPDMVKDLLANRIQVVFYPPNPAMISQVKAGTLRPLLTGTPQRLPFLPEVPAFEEVGAGPFAPGWFGLSAPAGTPEPVVARVHQAMLKAAATQQAQAGFDAMSVWVSLGTPAEMTALVRRDYAFWGDFIKKLGIKPE